MLSTAVVALAEMSDKTQAAIRNGFTVRYHRTARLLHTLSQVRSDGSLTATLRSLARCSLLILDDWMRDAISIQDAQNILEVLDDRFGNTSTIIATRSRLTSGTDASPIRPLLTRPWTGSFTTRTGLN